MTDPPPPDPALAHRHVRIGWWLLLAFLSLGVALETMHGFKVGFYLDADNETRRLMLTLAHAHGALLGLVNVVFGLTLAWRAPRSEPRRRGASAALLGASVLLPAGFLLGGLFAHGGDPGLGVLLVPIAAVLLFGAVLVMARG